jgi:hypothetical protein
MVAVVDDRTDGRRKEKEVLVVVSLWQVENWWSDVSMHHSIR